MTDHIADKIKSYFAAEGWSHAENEHGVKATKNIRFEKLAGSLVNGDRLVTLQLDQNGRWLESVDGWGVVNGCADLRSFSNKTAHEAVSSVIGEAYPL